MRVIAQNPFALLWHSLPASDEIEARPAARPAFRSRACAEYHRARRENQICICVRFLPRTSAARALQPRPVRVFLTRIHFRCGAPFVGAVNGKRQQCR